MKRYRIGPILNKRFSIASGIGEHQVDIKKGIGRPVECPGDVRPERDIGHEVAVHNVQMQPVSPCRDHSAGIIGQSAKITSEHGCGNPDHVAILL